MVQSMVDEYGRTVGYPSELEARRHLVLTNGDLGRATMALRLARKEKVCSANVYMCTYVYTYCHIQRAKRSSHICIISSLLCVCESEPSSSFFVGKRCSGLLYSHALIRSTHSRTYISVG